MKRIIKALNELKFEFGNRESQVMTFYQDIDTNDVYLELTLGVEFFSDLEDIKDIWIDDIKAFDKDSEEINITLKDTQILKHITYA